MITNRTIQHNSDRMYDISFILLSHNEENNQKVGFRDLKCKNGAQNRNLHKKLSKTGAVENFWLWSKSTVNDWRVLTWQCDVTLRLMWQYVKRSCRVWACGEHVEAVCPGAWGIRMGRGGAWSTCSWGRNFSRHVGARVRWFLAILGWVLLKIFCFVTQCLCFDSWMSWTMRSKSCWDCGRDGGDLLLTVTIGWRRWQQKNARDVHKNQKVRGMALIPC